MPSPSAVVEGRFNQLERKLERSPTYHQYYAQYMNEILKRWDSEEVPVANPMSSLFATFHITGLSPSKDDALSDFLPALQSTRLTSKWPSVSWPRPHQQFGGALYWVRQNPIANMWNVEKMTHLFHVKDHHRAFLRLMWWEAMSGDISTNDREYNIKGHVFSAKSSSARASYGPIMVWELGKKQMIHLVIT